MNFSVLPSSDDVMESGTRSWAAEVFGEAHTGDDRRLRRVVEVAAGVAAMPAGTVTQVFEDHAKREAAYRLLSNNAIKSESLAAAVFASTVKKCRKHERVYVAVDGSTLALTDTERKRDIGYIGAWNKPTRGLHVISALALDSRGSTLGLCGQTWWTRHAPQPKNDRRNRDRPISKKESRHSVSAVASVSALFETAAPDTNLVLLLDRGFDIAELLANFVRSATRCSFIMRANHDRRVEVPGLREKRVLKQHLRSTPILGHYLVDVAARAARPDRPERRARRARIQVQATRVVLKLGVRGKGTVRLPVNAIWAREIDGPANESISWLLLTNEPIDSYDQIRAVLQAYSFRWRVEEFHRSWKRGGGNVEDTQLRSREAILKWATIHAAVATRAVHLVQRSRSEPKAPASEEFTRCEIDAVILLRRKNARFKLGEVPDLKSMVQMIAEFGGYTGRSSGGPPGATVVARGLARIAIAAEVLSIERSDE